MFLHRFLFAVLLNHWIAPSTTYYSLHVWNYLDDAEDWNPGNFDALLGDGICRAVRAARRAAPQGSPLWHELVRREELIDEATEHMERGKNNPWWDPNPTDQLALNLTNTNSRNMADILRIRKRKRAVITRE